MFFARTRTSLGTRVLGTALVAGLLLFSLHAKEGRDLSFLRTKAPSALLEEMALLTANPVYDYPLPVIVQLEPELFSQNGEPDAVNASGGREADSRLTLINAYRARLTAGQIEVLLRSVSVEYVTLDARIRATSDVAGNTNTFLSTIGIGNMGASGPNGSGIVVAVFDSGIGSHPDLQGEKRIRTAVDFTTGEPVQRSSNVDEYGHGTAVAGIIGGTGREGIPTGVAPGVQFVDVKVIGPDGTGSTSNLIKAIEWLIRNRNRSLVSGLMSLILKDLKLS